MSRPLEEVVKDVLTWCDDAERIPRSLSSELRASLAEREKDSVVMKFFSTSSGERNCVYVDSTRKDHD